MSPSVKCLHILPIQLEGFCAVLHRFLVLLHGQIAERSDREDRSEVSVTSLGATQTGGSLRSDVDSMNTYSVLLTLHVLQSSHQPSPSPQVKTLVQQ